MKLPLVRFPLVLHFIVVVSAVMLAQGCASSDRTCDDAGFLIDQGKTKLSLGTDGGYVSAAVYFQDAINKGCSSNVDEARFGFVAATLLDWTIQITENIRTLFALFSGPPADTAPLGPRNASKPSQAGMSCGWDCIPGPDQIADNYIFQLTGRLEPILQEIQKNPNFSFRITSLPFAIDLSALGLGTQPIGNLGGNYSLTEVNAVYSFLRFLDGVEVTPES